MGADLEDDVCCVIGGLLLGQMNELRTLTLSQTGTELQTFFVDKPLDYTRDKYEARAPGRE